MPKLDRLVEFDERSRAYPIRTLLPDEPRSYTWRCDVWHDQGREGACVGFAWAHELSARPAVVPTSRDDAFTIYRLAQTLDQWPGENYSGTSVIAGIKALQQLFPDRIAEYRWAFGLEDALLTIGRKGPGVAGLNWYEGMDQVDDRGFIHVTGAIRGGHAILANGVNVKGRYVKIWNSWGPEWGRNGCALLSWDDFGRLLAEDGEFCLPVLRGR
ncbi:MAG: hypothetical protein M3N32_07845 [Actinomycetota bacterium]|nr:hypothetical protein [Actinomycetota bacterium]